MGSAHASCYSEIDGVEIAGIFSRNAERARAAAKKWATAAVTDPVRLISDGDIDAIDVCVPSANHRDFVIAALRHGKHVFCETPFALSLADAEEMIAASRDAKRILAVGLLLRSEAHYEHVHRIASSGEYGTVLSIVTFRLGSYLRPGAPDHKPHYSDPSTELMTFDFDFVLSVLGRPQQLSATSWNTAEGRPGEIAVVLDYGGMRSATVLASGVMPVSFPFRAGFRVLFEHAALELASEFGDGPPKTEFSLFSSDGLRRAVAIKGHNPYEKELRHFLHCVRHGSETVLLNPAHAVAALEMSFATQRALNDHTPVRLT